jgi:hypothetical protein
MRSLKRGSDEIRSIIVSMRPLVLNGESCFDLRNYLEFFSGSVGNPEEPPVTMRNALKNIRAEFTLLHWACRLSQTVWQAIPYCVLFVLCRCETSFLNASYNLIRFQSEGLNPVISKLFAPLPSVLRSLSKVSCPGL